MEFNLKRIEDPELRVLMARIQLEGIQKLLDAKITESIHLDSYGKETNRITVEYIDPVK